MNILLVDDQPSVLSSLKSGLNYQKSLEILKSIGYDIVDC